MRVLKQLLNFYIDSSVHVALSAYSLTWITLLEFHVPYDYNVLYFVFYATIFGYNFVKYFGVAKFHHRRLTNTLKAIQILSLLSFIGVLYYGLKLQPTTWYYVVILGVITFFYAIPFLPKRFFLDSEYNLRTIGGLKIYLIALVWSGVTVIIPLINNDHTINEDVIITAIQRYIFVLVLMLPFEIRDLQYDSLRLSTVPQKIGVKQTKILGVFLLVILLILEFFKENAIYTDAVILIIITACTLLLLVFSKVEQGKYYSAFWVEALPVFWVLFEVLGDKL